MFLYVWFKTKLTSTLKPTNADNRLKAKSLRLLMIRHMILCLGGIGLLAVRWYIMDGSPPVFQKVDNPASFAEETFIRVS